MFSFKKCIEYLYMCWTKKMGFIVLCGWQSCVVAAGCPQHYIHPPVCYRPPHRVESTQPATHSNMFPDRDRQEELPQEAGVVRCPAPLPAQPSHCSDLARICITVAPFTGGPFEVSVNKGDTIEELKKVIARRLKVSKERIYLLYRERWDLYNFSGEKSAEFCPKIRGNCI